MSDALAIRRLAQAIEILAIRTAGYIGTNDAEIVVKLCGEALDALGGSDVPAASMLDLEGDTDEA